MAAVAGIRSATATLTAATADTVTMSGAAKGRPVKAELLHHGDSTDVIYFRLDGTDPVVAADENEILLVGERLSITLPNDGIVKLISAGAATYSVIVTG